MTNACETLYLPEPYGGVPNNVLPVLLYRHVLPDDADDAAVWFEQRFGQHQWPARWRYPVFTYTHFHTNTHEVLGIYAGEAQIQLGGEAGPVVTLRTGDAVLIPAGVGHKQIDASADFMAVGAYPEGCRPINSWMNPRNWRKRVKMWRKWQRPGAIRSMAQKAVLSPSGNGQGFSGWAYGYIC
ncbi:Cupin domain-containing protein [Cronobacter sakazakii 680]|nr:Cupin domain-containing protein [Cronobacter sakazakii 680]